MLNYFYHKPRFLIRAYKYLFEYDKDEIKYIRSNLRKGDVAFDIGAHKGSYTYWMRKSVKKMGKIVSVEPQPILFEYLKRLFNMFNYSNVILMGCAVSDQDSEGVFTVPSTPGKTSQEARIDDQNIIKDNKEFYEIDVKIRSMDSIVSETGLEPNLVKIDVEGHEYSVLQGMENMLTNICPKIVIECEARHINNYTVFEVFNLLLKKGYEGFYYQNGIKKSLNQFDLKRDQLSYVEKKQWSDRNYVNNFIFEPR